MHTQYLNKNQTYFWNNRSGIGISRKGDAFLLIRDDQSFTLTSTVDGSVNLASNCLTFERHNSMIEENSDVAYIAKYSSCVIGCNAETSGTYLCIGTTTVAF